MAKKSSYKVKSISHLYWGKYPYKVVLSVPVEPFKDNTPWHYRVEAIHLAVKANVVRSEGVKCRQEANTPSYFFESEDEADDFISANLGLVKTYYRPENDAQIEVLADEKLRARKTLYFGRYRWCITMKPRYREGENHEIDEWIENYFDLDRPKIDVPLDKGGSRTAENHRVLYNYYWARTVYVNDLADVCAIKMSLSTLVKTTHCALLPGEAVT